MWVKDGEKLNSDFRRQISGFSTCIDGLGGDSRTPSPFLFHLLIFMERNSNLLQVFQRDEDISCLIGLGVLELVALQTMSSS
jgi:hypothetical protein